MEGWSVTGKLKRVGSDRENGVWWGRNQLKHNAYKDPINAGS